VIILHIGRHKTGTSAIQHFLSRNRPRLGRLGWDYPRSLSGRAAHHDFVAGLDSRRGVGDARTTPDGLVREAERMTAWLTTPGDKIVSSEAFQNLDPEILRDVFPAGRTRVLVYLREPLDYLISSYAQTIQAQAARTPFVNYAASFRPDYARFLDRWAAVFGDDAIQARVYDRSVLCGGDIVHDFVEALGLPADQVRFPAQAFNPSIGPELIEFKGVVNAVIPQDEQLRLRLYPRLARLAKRFPMRLRVSDAFARAYRAQFEAANAEVFARYLGRPGDGFPLRDLSGAPSTVDIAAATAQALKLLGRRSPDVADAIRARLPADVSALEPLLPTDWDAAVAALERSGPARG
jgi:hypothetical protein